MSSNHIALLIFFIELHFITNAATSPSFPAPTDYLLLDCGSSSDSTSVDGRRWKSDDQSSYLPVYSEKKSQNAIASKHLSSEIVPYKTARVFSTEFTYSFPELSPGHIFLRLYFYPTTYNQSFNTTSYFFSVFANKHTLLSNFSAFLTVSNNSYDLRIVKEYIIQISDDGLDLIFSPDQTTSHAFVNGIEIVSIPEHLYFQGNNVPLKTVAAPYYLHNNISLETIFRLNVGGAFVETIDDTGLFRSWDNDNPYVLTGGLAASRNIEVTYTSDNNYTAPESVYTSARFMNDDYSILYNMTWLFPVDSGFYYLLRLHFCEFFLEINKVNQRVFTIFINNQTVELEADVISWANGRPQVAVFRDYVTLVADPDGQRSKTDLRLSMKPNTEALPVYDSALLNGLEIFKISLPNGSLNSPNPNPAIVTTKRLPKQNKVKKGLLIVTITTAGTVALVVTFIGILVFKRRKTMNDSATPIVNHELPVIVNSICRHFSFGEMKRATGNFDENLVIGVGGFGSVYKGCIDNGLTEVAIKRLNPSSSQGFDEFQTEIEMLSKLRHLHLVSLIGYCHQKGEMILVYDYMSRGTLRDHLYNTKNSHLPWKQRLRICVGVARGIHYLHTGSEHTIIHRDIKSTNILLDENWVAKVSDFGLSKIGPISGSNYHISTMVKGSFGYLDPEYFLNQRLTDKSDVYSFGIVLLEMLCACPAITQDRSGEHISLAEWARLCNKDGTLDQIIDPNLKGEIASNCLTEYVKIAFKCLKRKGAYRPSMPDVAWSLEFALQLQENDEKSLSLKMTKEKYEASPSISIDQPHISEIDTSYNVFSNCSLSSLSF